MTTYFITRHTGALDWARRKGIEAERHAHLDIEIICEGDRVIGTLPVHIAAEICARGAQYLHLSMNIPEQARGRELSVDEMEQFGACLVRYIIMEHKE